jgi:hypothetical protein
MGWLWVALVAQSRRHARGYRADKYDRLYPGGARIAMLAYPGDKRNRPA